MSEQTAHDRIVSEAMLGVERYDCPLCDWCHLEKIPAVSPDALASVFGVGTMQCVAAQQKNWRVEKALEDHFRTHTTTQWLAKVTALQSELRRLKEQFP